MSFVENKEIVRIVAQKFDGKMPPVCKTLQVNPQRMSFDVLQDRLVKEFDIKTDFAIYYLAADNAGQSVYLSLLSDWDLDAALFGASDPQLALKIDLKPFEDDELDEEWDIVATSEIGRPSTEALRASNSLKSFISQKVSRVIQAIGMRRDENSNDKPEKPPMLDAEFHNFFDGVGHLVQPLEFRLSVYQGGVEPSLRRLVWRHLLNIYPHDMTGSERFDYLTEKSNEYYRLRSEWFGKDTENIRYISNMVRKDVVRTDRTHAFYAGSDENENVVALFNLLVTYAVTHPTTGYCQGMSDLASPLLLVEKDEAHAYVCFCALMKRVRTNFSEDGSLMTTKFEHLALLLQHHDLVFADYIMQENADMFFCYRWILLEMKREFPLDAALFMLEVMWSTMPFDPPVAEILLADPTYVERGNSVVSPSVANFIQLRARQRHLSSTSSTSLATGYAVSLDVGLANSVPSSDYGLHRIDSSDVTDFNGVLGSSSRSDGFNSQKIMDPAEKLQNSLITVTSGVSNLKSLNVSSTENGNSNCSAAMIEPSVENALNFSDRKVKSNIKHMEASKEGTDTALSDVDLGNGEETEGQTSLLDPAFVNITEVEKLVPLPPPTEFGCGNPFLMFLCLSLLLQHRDHIMTNHMDYNEIAVFFDRMVRKHDVHSVVHHAKMQYTIYLQHQQQIVAETSNCDANI